MEFLKAILGDELYAQVTEKLKGKEKEIKLANLAEGGYVGKDKFDAVEAQLKTAKDTITERDGQLTELKKLGDPAELKGKIEQLEKDNALAKQKTMDELNAMRIDLAAQAYAGGIKFTSKSARVAFVDQLKKAGLKLDEGGALIGADDIAKKAREADPDAFEKEPAGGAGFGDKKPLADPSTQTTADAVMAAMFPGKQS